jgi:hypothetical protein
MGYDVHITRTLEWTESESDPITADEWQAYVSSDDEMRGDGFAEVATASGTLRYENPGLAVWTAWSENGRDGNFAWFDLKSGRVTVKNPDDAILLKMCAIAERLGARVQGDEGEYYPLPKVGQGESTSTDGSRSW